MDFGLSKMQDGKAILIYLVFLEHHDVSSRTTSLEK